MCESYRQTKTPAEPAQHRRSQKDDRLTIPIKIPTRFSPQRSFPLHTCPFGGGQVRSSVD